MFQIDETGLYGATQGKRITRFQVLGERGSGTNVVRKSLQKNLDAKHVGLLGWKHGFPHAVAIPEDLAVICVTRNARDWARSLYARPWHAHPDMQALSFSEFIRAEWNTIIDRPADFGPRLEGQPVKGLPLQLDRDPISGLPFSNIFALRQAKLRALAGMLNRGCTCAYVRFEAFRDDPEAMTDRLGTLFGFSRKTQSFAAVHRRLGTRFNPSVKDRPPAPLELSRADDAFMKQALDLALEAAFGYRYT